MRLAEHRMPAAQSTVNIINDMCIADIIAFGEAWARVMFPTVTATTEDTIAMLAVCPMERLVASMDDATL